MPRLTKRFLAAIAARRRLLSGGGDTPDQALSTFTNGTWDVDADGSTTATLTYTAKNSAGNAIPGIPVTFAVARTFLSAANGVVTADPSEIPDDDATTSEITVYARDTSDVVVAGLPGANNVIAATGSGNTIVQPAAVTDYLGRATGTLRSSGAATKTVSVTQAGLAITDTASVVVSGSAPAGPDPAFHAYNNSSEVPDASGDANELWTDDFYRGFGVKGNAEGKAGVSNATTVFTGSLVAAGNVQYTAGLGGTIYYLTPFPDGTPVAAGRGGAINADSTLFVYTSGSSGEATAYNYTKQFKTSTQAGWLRFDIQFSADFLFGAQKVVDFLHPGADSGITWGNIHINLGSSPATTGNLAWQGVGGGNYTGLMTLERDHWYSIQIHWDNTGGAGAGILQMWCDDLGTDGNTVPPGGTPTIRLNVSNYTWTPSNGYSGVLFGAVKFGAYSNPGSEGTMTRTNVRVIAAGGPILIRDD